MKTVSQSELARLARVSPVTVHKLVNQGKLALRSDGMLDLETSLGALRQEGVDGETADPDETEQDARPEPTSFQKARALKEHYAAQRMKLRYERESAFRAKMEGTCPHCGKSIPR